MSFIHFPKIFDPFGNEYRYRKVADKTKQKNPDFDLWSCGANGKTSGTVPYDPNLADTKDDIW